MRNSSQQFTDVLRGQGGRPRVPWVQIMRNEFECLADRKGQGMVVSEKLVKKYYL